MGAQKTQVGFRHLSISLLFALQVTPIISQRYLAGARRPKKNTATVPGAAVRGDDRADLVDADVALDVREMLRDGLPRSFGLGPGSWNGR